MRTICVLLHEFTQLVLKNSNVLLSKMVMHQRYELLLQLMLVGARMTNTYTVLKTTNNGLRVYHTYVVMLFRSQTSFLCYFLFMYKFKVLYHSKSIG